MTAHLTPQRQCDVKARRISGSRAERHGVVDRQQNRQLVGGRVLDLAFVVVTCLFFVLATAYVRGCERLKKP
jgi:hypothetical protein